VEESPTKDGVYLDIPFSEYLDSPRLNHSHLKLLSDSAEQLKLGIDGDLDDEDTGSLAFGRACHSYILTPKLFERDYFVTKKIVKRGKDWDDMVVRYGAECILWEEDHAIIHAMRNRLAAHSLFPGLIKGAERELTIYFTLSGIECKARVDIWNEKLGLLGDLKTTRDCRPDFFFMEIFRRSYDTQLAWYKLALETSGFKVNDVLIVAQRKTPSYGLWIYKLMQESLERAEKANAELLAKYIECKKSDSWPGYPEVIYPVLPPAYFFKEKQGE
jgi:hypothetical protein